MMSLHSSEATAAAFEEAFVRIERERMRDVPILNLKLKVEACGFREWDGGALGALITPWFINLVFAPPEGMRDEKAVGDGVVHRFPAGAFSFLISREDALGTFEMCSLFSPVLEFSDQEDAVVTANAALDALFDADVREDTESKNEAIETSRETEEPDQSAPAQVSRRALFTVPEAGRTGH